MRRHVFAIAAVAAISVPGPAQQIRLVPQFGSGELVATAERFPALRIDGSQGHILQIHAPRSALLWRQIEFPDSIVSAVWNPNQRVAWVATKTGIHRVRAADGEVERVVPGCSGQLALHPDGRWLGVLGSTQPADPDGDRADRAAVSRSLAQRSMGALAVYDVVACTWIAQHPVPTDRHASLHWSGDTLHGAGAGGHGYRTRGGRGAIVWSHVKIHAPSAVTEQVESRSWKSRFEVDAPTLSTRVTADVEVPFPWVEPGRNQPGDSTQSVLHVDASGIDHVMSGNHNGKGPLPGRWRLTPDGFVEQIELARNRATTWNGPARRRPSPVQVPGFESRVQQGWLDVLWRTTQHVGAALLGDTGRDLLSRHAWDPRAGVLGAVWSRPFPVSGLWWNATTVDPGRERLLLHGRELPDAAFHVLDLATGETVHRFDGPWSDPQLDRVHHLAWSVDGQRILVMGGREMAVYDLPTATWSAPWARSSAEGRAFGVPGGWLVATWTCARHYDHSGTLLGEAALPRLQELQLHPGGRWAIASGPLGRAALVDLATMEVRSRWIDSGGSSIRTHGLSFPASTWSPNGRALLQVVGQAGRVRAIDLATGTTLLEWQTMFLKLERPGWLAWTPDGAWDGSSHEAGQNLLCYVDDQPSAKALNERRDPAAIRAAIASLFRSED